MRSLRESLRSWRCGLGGALLLAALAIVPACSTETGGTVPFFSVIGPEGGTLVIPLGQIVGEITLAVPENALSQEVTITVSEGQATDMNGWQVVGTVLDLTPPSTQFALPAMATIPYNPLAVSSAVQNDELRVARRSTTGQISLLVPTMIDERFGTVFYDTSALGTFWVVAPDVVSSSDLFPLNAGDSYRYDSGLVVTVEQTASEPNIAPLLVAKVTFTRDNSTFGIYFDNSMNQVSKVGDFRVSVAQRVLETQILLIGARDAVGTTRLGVSTYDGFVPFPPTTSLGTGSTSMPEFQGLSVQSTEIAERVRLTVPLGAFNTVRVPTVNDYTETSQQTGEVTGQERVELWLAMGVGPVAIRFDNGPLEELVEATVNGREVTGGL